MTSMPRAHAALAVVLAVSLTTLTACHPGALGAGSTSAKASAAASLTASATPTPTPTPSVMAAPPCTRDTIVTTYTDAGGSPGHFHGVLHYQLHGSAPCSLTGYPVVYLGNSEVEGPMGAASTNAPGTVSTVNLTPGGSAQAAVTITDASIISGCTLVTTVHLVASPPITHPFDFQADGQRVTIPSTPGCVEDSIGLVQVGPITAG